MVRRNSLFTKGRVGLGILNPSAKLHVSLPIRLTRKYKIKRILNG